MLTMDYNSKSMAEKRQNVKRELRRLAFRYHLDIYFKDALDFNSVISACLVKNSAYINKRSYEQIRIDLFRFDGDDYSCIKDIMEELSDRDNFDDLNITYGMYEQYKLVTFLAQIEDVIFNDPATIVFWSDGTKTVVKAQDGEEFDPEKGLAMAITKKKLGNNGNYYNHIKKWLEPYYKKNETEE